MSVSTPTTRPADTAVRLSGALIGLVVFFVGVGLLYGVFETAHTLYNTPAPKIVPAATPAPIATPTPAPNATPNPSATPAPATPDVVSAISSDLTNFAKQWLLLFIMCIAGSFIASRGIELFFRACAAATVPHPKVVVPPAPSDP